MAASATKLVALAPHAHTLPVTHVHDIADGTHGAKMAAPRDGAENHREAETSPENLGGERVDSRNFHSPILSGNGNSESGDVSLLFQFAEALFGH